MLDRTNAMATLIDDHATFERANTMARLVDLETLTDNARRAVFVNIER